jgi:hypothetical protein
MSPGGASPAGASEYTRMLGALAPPKGPPAPAPLPIAPPPPPTVGAAQGSGSIKSYLPLILALNVVLIAVTGVILYFALK